MTTEFVVLAPIVIVHRAAGGRARPVRARQTTRRTGRGRRRPGRVTHRQQRPGPDPGRAAAAGSLSDAGLSCTGMTADVDTGSFRPGGVVTVTITCTADLSGLAISGLPGTATITATGRAPLEAHRQIADSRGSAMTPRARRRRRRLPAAVTQPLDPASGRLIRTAGRSPPTC